MINLNYKSVSFSQNGTNLLGPIDLEINLRGITNVLGYNGAGKSLFLELCHALIMPQSGQIKWDGQPASTTRASRGYIFQHRITLRRSVKSNIALPMQAASWPKNTIETHETPVKAMNLCVLEYKDLIILWATLMSNGFSHTSRT